MTKIIKNYCPHCDKPPLDSQATVKKKAQAKVIDLSARMVSHLNEIKKTIKAHPLPSALLGVAVLACFVAAAVLMGTGFGGIGVMFIGIGVNVLISGSLLMNHYRKQIQADEFKKAHALDDKAINRIQGKNVCLILEATHDQNGALKMDKGPAKWEKKYPIVHVKVSNIEEVKTAIDEVAQHAHIEVLWFTAHGCQDGISLSKADSINVHNVDELQEDFNKLNDNATIILDACETAKTPKGQPHAINIAQRISEVAERRVLAGSLDIGKNSLQSDLKVKMKKEAKFGIEVPRWGSRRRNPKEYIQSGVCSLVYIFAPNIIGRHFKKSALRVYDKGVLQSLNARYVTV